MTAEAVTVAAERRSRLVDALPEHRGWAFLVALLVVPVPFARLGVGVEGLAGAFVAVVLVWLAAKDLETRKIPNVVVLPAAAIVLLAVAAFRPGHLLESVIAALAAAAFLSLPSIVMRGAVGMGDVKLAFLIGAVLGRGTSAGLLLGCLAGSGAALYLLVRHGSRARKMALPFAPFLAFGALAALAAGAPHAL
jgi:leader peptidase (prepilin peptidase) / N-methyltransferase